MSIQSRTTRRFWGCSTACPSKYSRSQARVSSLSCQPGAPQFTFKKVEGENDIYSVRIGLDYRALAVMKGDRVVRCWIGGHSEYDRLV